MTNWLAELDGSMEARVVLHYGVAIQLYKTNFTKHAALPQQTVYVYRLMPCRQATIAATSVHSELSISKTVAVVFVNYV